MKNLIRVIRQLILDQKIGQGSIQRLNPKTILNPTKFGFTQIVRTAHTGNTIYISGQFSGDLHGVVQGKTVQEQMKLTFQNLKLAIAASAAKPEHVTKIQVLIVNHQQDYLSDLVQELDQLFGQHLPASTLIPVPRLALDEMLFEIDATLFVPK